ncbi:MAG: YIP1 family protein [Acidobacteria bacterium]|nr:YIP1 family protein [Acidobacteriota bacterium]MBU4307757.1 YIP1 family protein [Acidobacteriota bacterium]MCG2812765.1 YIP1 family protein [Candidatus Aminicenantes bacterium]
MNLIKRVKNILLTPKTEWQVIKGEPLSIAGMFTKYAMILAAIPALAGFIGYSLVGVSLPFFGTFRYPLSRGLAWALLTYVLSLAGAFFLALIVDNLAPWFGAKKNLVASAKAVVFANTAAWIGGIFAIFPSLSMLAALVGIYSLVLLWMGMKLLKEVPPGKMTGYFLVTLIAAVAIFFLIGLVVSSAALGGGSAAGVFGTPAL